MASLELVDIAVSYEGRPILHAVDLAIPDGERVALLGASGSGKTTLLRAVAGLQRIDRGSILLGGQDISGLSEAERDISLLVQSARLYHHRGVAGNLGFPLELHSVPRSEIAEQVRAQARAFALDELLERRTSTLSAGETAEVALARALIRRSALLLMDEPFTRVGPAERPHLTRDVIAMQEGYGSTMLVATSDWLVAAIVAPTIAVLGGGRILQVGPPIELIGAPATLDVAWLVADGPLNLLPGRLERRDGRTALVCEALRAETWDLSLTARGEMPVQVVARAAACHLADPGEDAVWARVVAHTFLGDHVDVTVATDDAQLIMRCARPVPKVGERIRVAVDRAAIHVFDPDGVAIAHGV